MTIDRCRLERIIAVLSRFWTPDRIVVLSRLVQFISYLYYSNRTRGNERVAFAPHTLNSEDSSKQDSVCIAPCHRPH